MTGEALKIDPPVFILGKWPGGSPSARFSFVVTPGGGHRVGGRAPAQPGAEFARGRQPVKGFSRSFMGLHYSNGCEHWLLYVAMIRYDTRKKMKSQKKCQKMANPLTFGFEKTKTRKKWSRRKNVKKWPIGFCYVNGWIFSAFLIGPGGLPPHKIFRRSSFSGAERVRGSFSFFFVGGPGGLGVHFRSFTPHKIGLLWILVCYEFQNNRMSYPKAFLPFLSV